MLLFEKVILKKKKNKKSEHDITEVEKQLKFYTLKSFSINMCNEKGKKVIFIIQQPKS